MSLLLLGACIFISDQELEEKFFGLPEPLRLQSLEPDYGSVGSRVEVTLQGGDFDDTTRIFLGEEEATVVQFGRLQITARFDGTQAEPGPRDLRILREFDATELTISGAFTFFSDRSGEVGIVGWLERGPGDESSARLAFTRNWEGTAADQLSPPENCSLNYTPPSTGEIQDLGPGSLLLDSSPASSPLELQSTEAGDFVATTQNAVGGDYDLISTRIHAFPDLQQELLFSMPEPISLTAPQVEVGREGFAVEWVSTQEEDQVILRLQSSLGEWSATCRGPDSGYLYFPPEAIGSTGPAELKVGRLRERQILLPWDGSTASTAAVSWMAKSLQIR